MESTIFVPHDELERENCKALAEYLGSMFFC